MFVLFTFRPFARFMCAARSEASLCILARRQSVHLFRSHFFSVRLPSSHRWRGERGESSAASIVPASSIQHQPNKNHRSQLNGTEYVPLYVCICMIYAACLTSMRSKSIINELQCALCIHFKFSWTVRLAKWCIGSSVSQRESVVCVCTLLAHNLLSSLFLWFS